VNEYVVAELGRRNTTYREKIAADGDEQLTDVTSFLAGLADGPHMRSEILAAREAWLAELTGATAAPSPSTVDLSTISTDELRAELLRREAAQ
jgi:hypothetical protein